MSKILNDTNKINKYKLTLDIKCLIERPFSYKQSNKCIVEIIKVSLIENKLRGRFNGRNLPVPDTCSGTSVTPTRPFSPCYVLGETFSMILPQGIQSRTESN